MRLKSSVNFRVYLIECKNRPKLSDLKRKKNFSEEKKQKLNKTVNVKASFI